MRIRRQLSAHSLVFPVFCFTPAPSHHFLLLAEDEGCQDRKALNRLGIPEIEQQVRWDSSHFSTHRAGKPVSHFERQVLKISPRSAIQASRIREPAIVRPQSDLRISEISLPFMALEKIAEEILNGAPERIRTSGLCLRRAALYPAELRVHWNLSLCELFKDRKFNHANRSRQNSSPSTNLSTSSFVL